MTETEHYRLKKPEGNEYVGPGAFNENAEVIDGILHELETGKAGLDPETGKVKPEQLPEMDYEGTLKDAPEKDTPAEGDGLVLVDGGDQRTRKLLWSRVKAVLKEWLDTLYAAASHSHVWDEVTEKPVAFPPSWHSHPRSEITDFPESMEPTAHTHGAGDIASGTLSLERLPTVPLSKGGTGAGTAAGARANLGACGTVGPVVVTVAVESWAGTGPWVQTVSVAGVTAADNHIGVYPVDVDDPDARKLYEKAYGCLAAEAETVAGGVKLTCRDACPKTAFQVKVQGVK